MVYLVIYTYICIYVHICSYTCKCADVDIYVYLHIPTLVALLGLSDNQCNYIRPASIAAYVLLSRVRYFCILS